MEVVQRLRNPPVIKTNIFDVGRTDFFVSSNFDFAIPFPVKIRLMGMIVFPDQGE